MSPMLFRAMPHQPIEPRHHPPLEVPHAIPVKKGLQIADFRRKQHGEVSSEIG